MIEKLSGIGREQQAAFEQKATDNAQRFVSTVEQYIDVAALDRDLLHQLLDRIEIGQSYVEHGDSHQKVDIYFRFIGKI